MQTGIPTPAHGLKQTTDKGNILICLIPETQHRIFFYLSPEGKYLVHPFTKNCGELPNKKEWNFLFGKTAKVEPASAKELAIAETLLPCIREDRHYAWTLAEAVTRNENVIKYAAGRNGSSLANVPGFEKLLNKV